VQSDLNDFNSFHIMIQKAGASGRRPVILRSRRGAAARSPSAAPPARPLAQRHPWLLVRLAAAQRVPGPAVSGSGLGRKGVSPIPRLRVTSGNRSKMVAPDMTGASSREYRIEAKPAIKPWPSGPGYRGGGHLGGGWMRGNP
jgi:hypothetical protein